MPTMGKPISGKSNPYSNVTIASKPKSNSINDANMKERLVNKLTGFKPKDDLYVDGKKHNQMGKNEFLKLLTFQLQHQDPLKPMDQKDMAAELAQFSQLEQLTNLNTKFDNLGKNQNIEEKFYGASFLGKEVVTSGNSLKLTEAGGQADVLFSLPQQASKVLVRVYDNNNAMVGEMWRENIGRGSQNIVWDGQQLDGQQSAKGEYRVQVFAWDRNAEPIEVKSQVKGIVESVYFENGESVLKVAGRKVFLRDVDSFHSPGAGRLGQEKQIVANAFAGVEVKTARNSVKNLPVAQSPQTKVNLNKIQQRAGMNTYGKQQTNSYSDDLTSVYDD